MREFSDYIVYVDESGDHGLTSINPDYPIFVLAFCLFEKRGYLEQVVPAIQDLKFRYFGHDMVILHEAEIRKARPPFEFLLNPRLREPFMEELTDLISRAPFTIVATAIRKEAFAHRKGVDHNPYHIAMEYGLERVFLELQGRGQRGKLNHVVFERRGRQEDEALELEFRRIMDRTQMAGMGETLDLVLADKQVNSAGLQLADMVARPIGRHILDPSQPNRAFAILEPKIRRDQNGKIQGWGLKCYP
ncbi:3-deoxy-D-manno-octulosonic acid transferase [Thiohalorhabdus denitrificans]|uniref:3-deoxy-D-manno-octulosonic acid transferase n=1 Tax=Thiohalorhabdus denitrificans TaxID=381306 RepID=A0A0P9C7P3_9GAMM|nr:DUF3800 domain-containing protein [Thiohalorhabdus denitrificans]KPV41186.1 3-deoxy-D-manno-octulosonic acid transferase [Thiohalorhabdus denitrificans]SCY35310.1 Protein of unknown function [Thiohalorhabdus denitrificans]